MSSTLLSLFSASWSRKDVSLPPERQDSSTETKLSKPGQADRRETAPPDQRLPARSDQGK
jgi:hypothetical protein